MKLSLTRTPAKKNQHFRHSWEKGRNVAVKYPDSLRQKFDAMPKDADYQWLALPDSVKESIRETEREFYDPELEELLRIKKELMKAKNGA